MRTEYIYTIDNQHFTVFDINSIPEGVEYKSIEVEDYVEYIDATKIITALQLRLVLIEHSIPTTMIYGMIDNIEDEQLKLKARAKFDYATEIHRDDETLGIFGSLYGFTDDDLDNLFIEGSQL